jgi:hypothetical protein
MVHFELVVPAGYLLPFINDKILRYCPVKLLANLS